MLPILGASQSVYQTVIVPSIIHVSAGHAPIHVLDHVDLMQIVKFIGTTQSVAVLLAFTETRIKAVYLKMIKKMYAVLHNVVQMQIVATKMEQRLVNAKMAILEILLLFVTMNACRTQTVT